ncbi:MAG: PQQ-dependent sugar dehydrogenase [Cellvibrionaceae bacterium]|nr:PQQ-dependent sugar dehydrogenase [Cellvibrionaceae bacterium]
MSILKKLLWALLALIVLLAIVLVGLFSFGPLSIASIKAILNVAIGYSVEAPAASTVAERFKVPAGFSVGRYAEGLPKVRFIEVSRGGDLLAVLSRDGQLVLLKRDTNGDARHDGQELILDGLKGPNDLEFYRDWLYIAETNAVGRLPFDQERGVATGPYQRIITELPDSGNHRSKSIRIYQGKLLLSIGSTCNVCIEQDKRRATIMSYDLDGKNGQIYAAGLRNSVGLDVAPWDNQVYATDNGRDLLGDDYPVCELNKIERGKSYGWPYINGFGDLDPDFGVGQEARLQSDVQPVFGFKAHNAPLGIRFIRRAHMPEGFERSALVALHGSWNRSKADGYKVVSLHWAEDGSISSRDFLSGFELNEDVIGRPVDIAEGQDGCVYISDDYAGSIYRVCYQQTQNTLVDLAAKKIEDKQFASLSTEELRVGIAEGEALYQQYPCASCHLFNGEGEAGGKTLDGLASRYSMAQLANYFLSPNAPMPAYPLDIAKRRALAIYLLAE